MPSFGSLTHFLLQQSLPKALVAGYRRQVKQLIRTVGALVADREHVDDDEIEELYEALIGATDKFAKAFNLG